MKYIKTIILVMFLCFVLYVLFFVFLFLHTLLFPKEEKCTETHVSSVIVVRDMYYLPQKAQLYCYEQEADFKKLILSEELSPIKKSDDGVDLNSTRDAFDLKYDYRLVVDDTICFDLSNYPIKPDTLGRTMTGWSVMCKLVGYNCNGVACENKVYQVLDPPFVQQRIIKKGIYDE